MVAFRLQFKYNHFPIALGLFLIVTQASTLGSALPAIPDFLFTRIKVTHPRLIINPGAIETIQLEAKSNEDFSGGLNYLRKQADSLLLTPPSAYILDDSSLLETSRTILERVKLLAFFANVDGSRKYADRALAELESAGKFPSWGPVKFLDVAEMAAAFALGYDWLYSFMSPTQRTAMAAVINEKVFSPALKEFENREWWVASRSNWNPVCNGGLAMAALALGNDVPIAKSILHRSLLSLQQSGALDAFSPDGAYSEGIGYWSYTCQYLAMLFASLQTALNDDFGLSNLPGLAETGLFPIYCEGPTGRMLNYGDAPDARLYPFWMAGFGLYYKKPLYSWFSQNHTGLNPLELLWYDPTAKNQSPESLPLSKRFHGPDLAIFRTAWNDSNAGYLSLKAGNPKNEHSHLDVGNFVYEAQGVRWALDLGSDKYSLPHYFIDYDDSASRFTYYRVRAEGHNTLTFNPSMAPDQELFPASFLQRFDANTKIAIGDLTAAYGPQAVQVLRGVALREGGAALIQDEYKLRSSGEVWWRMHTEASIAIAKDGHSAILTLGGKRLSVTLMLPKTGAVLSSMKAEPLAGTPRPFGQNTNPGISVLCVNLKAVQQGTLALWLVPLKAGEDFPSSLPLLESLDSPFWNPTVAITPKSNRWGSAWKVPFGTGSMRFQNNFDGLRFEVLQSGKFHLRILSLQGELLSEIHGMAPGEFTLKSSQRALDQGLLDFQMKDRRIQTLLHRN